MVARIIVSSHFLHDSAVWKLSLSEFVGALKVGFLSIGELKVEAPLVVPDCLQLRVVAQLVLSRHFERTFHIVGEENRCQACDKLLLLLFLNFIVTVLGHGRILHASDRQHVVHVVFDICDGLLYDVSKCLERFLCDVFNTTELVLSFGSFIFDFLLKRKVVNVKLARIQKFILQSVKLLPCLFDSFYLVIHFILCGICC